jgi:ABC-type dipeptide/oligopeptide/nickel transport system ATPase component
MKNGKYRRLGRNDMAMIFQDTKSCFEVYRPVDEQIAEIFRERRKLSMVKGMEAAQQILEQTGLSALRGNALPGELSGGQRQMAAVAFILAKGSGLLLADENFNALDRESRSCLFDLLAEYQKDNGTGILFFSRHENCNENCTDGRSFRTLKLESGKLVHNIIRRH